MKLKEIDGGKHFWFAGCEFIRLRIGPETKIDFGPTQRMLRFDPNTGVLACWVKDGALCCFGCNQEVEVHGPTPTPQNA